MSFSARFAASANYATTPYKTAKGVLIASPSKPQILPLRLVK